MAIGPWEIVVLLIVLVIIFGAGRLSQVGGALGKSVREFRGAVQDEPAAARVAVVAPPVFCTSCGASNPATNRFCSTCGATMGGAAAVAAPASVVATTETTQAVPPTPGVGAPETVQAHEAVTTPAVVPTNTCPSCATINPPGQPFCGQCGTRLGTAAA